ncbi:MAG: response regulator [Cyanobacteria bacterium P01_F01_bin.150]
MANILIMEDDIALATYWQNFLEMHDHRVVCCSTVARTIEQTSYMDVDLIIADMMIKVDGELVPEGGLTLLCKRITGALPSVPILGVSGRKPDPKIYATSPLQIAEGMGIDMVLYKPIPLEILLDAIEQLLAKLNTSKPNSSPE